MKRFLFLITVLACLSTVGASMKLAYEIGPRPDFINRSAFIMGLEPDTNTRLSAYEIGPRPGFQAEPTV